MLIGDHPALDFVNSVLAPSGEPLDFLRDGKCLGLWLQSSGVLPPWAWEAVGALKPAQADRLADEARDLREAFRRLLLARAHGATPAAQRSGIDLLNRALARGPLIQALNPAESGWRLELRRDAQTHDRVVAELAALCADLLSNQPEDQVRKCENPACTLWFNDYKRGPKRRWCSMAICGNRMKVAAHRARQKSAD